MYAIYSTQKLSFTFEEKNSVLNCHKKMVWSGSSIRASARIKDIGAGMLNLSQKRLAVGWYSEVIAVLEIWTDYSLDLGLSQGAVNLDLVLHHNSPKISKKYLLAVSISRDDSRKEIAK